MRAVLPSLIALGLLAAPLASANQCARPIEKAAFDVAGLKSELMVIAISCQAQSKYNDFIQRYRTSLVSEEHMMNSYFQRAYGRSAQRQHDDYITLLANSQSDAGIQQGTLFCMKNVGLFDEVMGLKDSHELPNFATGKALPQPIVLLDCPAKPAKVTRTAKK
jgi:hypothetical protein